MDGWLQRHPGLALPLLIFLVLMTSQDHLEAFNAFKYLRSLSLPNANDLGMPFYPPLYQDPYRNNPDLERLQKQAEDIFLGRLIRGISVGDGDKPAR